MSVTDESAKPQYKAARHYDTAPQLYPDIAGDALSSLECATFATFLALYGGSEPVVDVGCGTGRVGRHLSQVLKPKRLVSMDVSRREIDLARTLGNHAHSSLYMQGDVLHLPLARIQYGVCHGVVHHTPDPDRAMNELASALVPGGVLYLAIYDKSWYSRLYQLGAVLRKLRERGLSPLVELAFAAYFLPRYVLRVLETKSVRRRFNIRGSFEDCLMTPYAHFFSDRELRTRFQALKLEVLAHERLNYGAMHCYVLRKF